MDWKYILSITPENLSEDDKDQLYSSIAWFDYESESLDKKKYLALLKISQEIMKYKSEQVEALLAELDEIAVRQGEEEGRKQATYDELENLKSKKTSDYGLEEKYKEMKSRLKQQMKSNENQRKDIEKLQQTATLLEAEKSHLQEELRSVLSRGDESHSDVSESGGDQQKELVHMVQEKNKQISTLLSDIEGVESENLNLKETISKLQDNLQDATAQVNLITKEFTAMKIQFGDSTDSLKGLNDENEALKQQIHDILEDKQFRDKEIDNFTAAVDSRVDEWKTILDEKNDEIEKLKMQLNQASRHSSESSIEVDYSHGEVLSKVVSAREEQLMELQTQLQSATREMDKSTLLIQQLNVDKGRGLEKIEELDSLMNDLKGQLQSAHERCRELQENVAFAESTAKSKQDDLDEITKNLRSNKEVQLANNLEKIQKLKSEIRIQEKKIYNYVKIINKLQNSVDDYEQENIALRDKCGISSDEIVDINGVLLKKVKESKELEKLQKQVLLLEDEKLQLKGRIHNLNRQLSTIPLPVVSNDILVTKEDEHDNKNDNKYLCVLEENDALRKGLREVLESIQTKNESTKREIKSETLENLLKALDMRHISGWYHPAMRLQAELHTVQGINVELREQLRIARLEFNNYFKESKEKLVKEQTDLKSYDQTDNRSPSETNKALNLEFHLQSSLEGMEDQNLTLKLEEYSKMFEVIDQQLSLLYDQYTLEKSEWETKEKNYETTKNILEEKTEVLEAKLKEFANGNEEESQKLERFAEMSANMVILNRKCVFLENEESKLVLEAKKLKTDLKTSEIATLEKINELQNENKHFQMKIAQTERILNNTVDVQTFRDMQNNLDNLTVKYRKLLTSFNAIKSDYSSELVVLSETVKLFQQHKDELQYSLAIAKTKANLLESATYSNEMEVLAKKLAQCEVNEISEKQRANHMSNLYNLVKEQLEKSEKRLGDLDKQNQGLLQKNLLFQESVKELENKLVNFVDVATIKEVEARYEAVWKEKEELTLKNQLLNNCLIIAKKKNLNMLNNSESSNAVEILNLKHQILDLQASSDDKALIARLSSDVILARLSETQCQKRLEELEIDLKEYQDNFLTTKTLLEQEKINKANITEQLQNKIRTLEQVLRHCRQQFLGSLPLVSQEAFNENLQQILKDKQAAFRSLDGIRKTENECLGLKEELRKRLHLIDDFQMNTENFSNEVVEKFKNWHHEKNIILIKELKSQREVEFKNVQLEQITHRLNYQDELISKLQEELLECYNNQSLLPTSTENKVFVTSSVQTETEKPKLSKQQEIQTNLEVPNLTPLQLQTNDNTQVTSLKSKIKNLEDEMNEKNKIIDQQKSKITETEMNVSLFRTQIGDKQSQIAFYEKHILELQNKISKISDESSTIQQSAIVASGNEEIALLKDSLAQMQETNVHKDEIVLKLQRLLKKDRDEHSLAAARMQQEMQRLQDTIYTQDKAFKELKETSIQHPGKAAIEQYILQVHALEKHTADLHTNISTLTSQLQASRQEAVRWQTLANERLDSMEQLRNDLEDQHQNELQIYKKDSERWREEIVKVRDVMSKHRSGSSRSEPELTTKLREKDDRIHELNVSLRHLRNEMRKHSEKSDSIGSPKLSEMEFVNEQQAKEYETLKKRYEQVLQRERMAKDEIFSLKEQLLKKPISARSDKNEKEQQLQKKLTSQEKEIENLRIKLERQMEINGVHKIAVTEDFEKWKKQKYWQQTADKLKVKLQEKSDECEKLNGTCSGYKSLIERLEREKHGLEGRIKALRTGQAATDVKKFDALILENEELQMQMQALNAKMEMQQHHSGALGAAMLQEKLEAQERKIAVLELSSKGSAEVRGEIERLQSTIENLQKLNLRLEAESLELKLDLEKSCKDVPHLREQIDHLENYVRVLKSENETQEHAYQPDDKVNQKQESKKVSELERTVFILKRVVEKLQVENKRLQGGSRPCSSSVNDRLVATDKLRADYMRMKEQHSLSMQQVARLEEQLSAVNNKNMLLEKRANSAHFEAVSLELTNVKNELSHKSQLLDKVKILLHRAAVKEKALLEEIGQLKAIITRNSNASSLDSNLS